jgi:DNA-binding NarL/FixJ family response regulator
MEDRLTPGEVRILSALSMDRNHNEVAKDLYLSHQTVKFHTTNIRRKLEVHTTHGAIAKAMRQGLIK